MSSNILTVSGAKRELIIQCNRNVKGIKVAGIIISLANAIELILEHDRVLYES